MNFSPKFRSKNCGKESEEIQKIKHVDFSEFYSFKMPPKSKSGMKRKEADDTEGLTRIAIVNSDKCKPKRCRQECKKSCPVVRMGKLCIEVTPNDKIATISEDLCIGCGICVKKCPFEAVNIINLPSNLSKETTHRYSANSFKLHRLPTPRPGCVLGLVGTNGIGKSTALKILAGTVLFLFVISQSRYELKSRVIRRTLKQRVVREKDCLFLN